MDRDAMIEAVEMALDNVHDMDVPWSIYAAAAVDALGWRAFEADKPDDGDFIVVTDCKARWVDCYFLSAGAPRFGEHIATHWHPVQSLPKPVR